MHLRFANISYTTTVGAALCVMLAGLGSHAAVIEGIEAKVNNEIIFAGEIDEAMLFAVRKPLSALNPDEYDELRATVLASMIRERIIIQESKRVIAQRGIDQDVINNEIEGIFRDEMEKYDARFETPEARLEDLSRQGLDEQALQEYLRDRASNRYHIQASPSLMGVPIEPVTPEEIEKLKTEHPEDYRELESVVVRHILFRCPEDAPPEEVERTRSNCEEILLRLKAGESFVDLAEKHSEHEGTRERGGLLGEVKRGVYSEAYNDFVETLLTTRPGQPIGPVRSPMGNHVCLITAKQTANSVLFRQHLEVALSKWVEEILERPETDVYIKGARPGGVDLPVTGGRRQ